jgi:hypothetical protein
VDNSRLPTDEKKIGMNAPDSVMNIAASVMEAAD